MYDVVALGELLIDFTESGKSEQGNQLLEVKSRRSTMQCACYAETDGKKDRIYWKSWTGYVWKLVETDIR